MARDVTQKRLYLETMEDILKNANKVVIDRSAGGGSGVLPFLPLPGLTSKGAAAKPAGGASPGGGQIPAPPPQSAMPAPPSAGTQ